MEIAAFVGLSGPQVIVPPDPPAASLSLRLLGKLMTSPSPPQQEAFLPFSQCHFDPFDIFLFSFIQ